ncbi:hypothetical protein LIA77_09785 [Sarocladium implicatum]|nr:hypothetical protein LIA77_09785 [Sarocladium implicatum]
MCTVRGCGWQCKNIASSEPDDCFGGTETFVGRGSRSVLSCRVFLGPQAVCTSCVLGTVMRPPRLFDMCKRHIAMDAYSFYADAKQCLILGRGYILVSRMGISPARVPSADTDEYERLTSSTV